MSLPVYNNRSMLIVHGEHAFELDDAINALASIHRVLRNTLGRTCKVHALFNKDDLPHLCTLEEMDEDFIRSLFEDHPGRGNQPMLSAIFTYQTRTRVAQGMFNFDHTIDSLHLSIDMPNRGIPRKHIIALAESIIEHLDPQWMVYHNRALIDAFYRVYPRFFRTAWLTYHTGMASDLPRWRTLEILETTRGVMCVAKPEWFGRTDEDLIEELVELDEMIEDVSPYGW
tara:strand:- start:10169 stop:10852 length:684 start_codon:yes stop_codon:yes gene_type:complete